MPFAAVKNNVSALLGAPVELADVGGSASCPNRAGNPTLKGRGICLFSWLSFDLQTKQRHVDIPNLWLRGAAHKKRIRVAYTPTAEMLAEGLTKALTADTFRRFRVLVGVVDVKDMIEARRLKIIIEDLCALENSFQGGEGYVDV